MKTVWMIATLFLLALAACGDGQPAATPDGGTNQNVDAGVQCFTNPTTHDEIINACTTAAQIDKTPVLPLLHADGTLPPIP